MAQVNDLLITGKTRALNPINGSCTNGTTVTTQTQSTKFMREDGTWSAPSYTAATTDKYHTTGTWSGLTYTATANGGAGALAFTIPTGTTASTVCVGNDSRLSDARTPTSHTHGNIQNGGTLQTTDITIGSGDKLVVTDSSDSSKVARTSISFDGSTATKCLTQKGTWETFGTSNLTIGTTSTTAMAGNTAVNNVAQTATDSTNATYELLFSGTADNTTRNEGARKTSGLTFNPSTGALNVSGSLNFASTSLTSSMDAQGLTVAQTGNSTTSIAYGTIGISDRSDSISMSSSDITLNSKWDGTNTSLKTAVTGAKGTVTQTATDSTNADYELLFSSTADNTTRTEGARKTQYLKFNPSTHTLSTYDSSYASTLMPNYYYTASTTAGEMAAIGINNGFAMAQLGDSAGGLGISTTDIVLMGTDNTWDGSNSSLRGAVNILADRNWYTYVEFTDKNNVAASTVINMGSWKPTVGGVYLFNYVARFSSNATGYRKLSISTSSSTISGMDRFGQISTQACNGDHTYMSLTAIETLTANTTYYFNAYHSAGAALNITASGLKIMRIR